MPSSHVIVVAAVDLRLELLSDLIKPFPAPNIERSQYIYKSCSLYVYKNGWRRFKNRVYLSLDIQRIIYKGGDLVCLDRDMIICARKQEKWEAKRREGKIQKGFASKIRSLSLSLSKVRK